MLQHRYILCRGAAEWSSALGAVYTLVLLLLLYAVQLGARLASGAVQKYPQLEHKKTMIWCRRHVGPTRAYTLHGSDFLRPWPVLVGSVWGVCGEGLFCTIPVPVGLCCHSSPSGLHLKLLW